MKQGEDIELTCVLSNYYGDDVTEDIKTDTSTKVVDKGGKDTLYNMYNILEQSVVVRTLRTSHSTTSWHSNFSNIPLTCSPRFRGGWVW